MRGKKDRHEALRARVAARNKTGWKPASLNVTQAAVHKERWREEITEQKKISCCQLETGQIYRFGVANKELAGMLVDGATLHYIPQQGNLIQGKSRLALKNWKNQLEKTA